MNYGKTLNPTKSQCKVNFPVVFSDSDIFVVCTEKTSL